MGPWAHVGPQQHQRCKAWLEIPTGPDTSLTRGSSWSSERGVRVPGDACPSLFAPAGRRGRGQEQQQLRQRLGGNHTNSSVLGLGWPKGFAPANPRVGAGCGCYCIATDTGGRKTKHPAPPSHTVPFLFFSCPRTTAVTRMRRKTKISISMPEQQRMPWAHRGGGDTNGSACWRGPWPLLAK